MIVDGRKIAEDVYGTLRKRTALLHRAPVLSIITCAPNFETKKYLSLKEKKASEVGITTRVTELSSLSSTQDFIDTIDAQTKMSDGIIVQLPLPGTVDVNQVTGSIPVTHDVDVLNHQNHTLLSPVVGAIREILLTHGISPKGKLVTVLGSGRLVGLPSHAWFTETGAHVSVVTKDTSDIAYYTKTADIIVCGAGVPGLLRPEMVKEGAVILDAGTSEEGGELKGDADPRCAQIAGLFTPVPGGIGPITIAMLLRNVVDCAEKKEAVV